MAKIPLIQQTELPPGRAGIAKPPLSLADQAGQIRLGQITASFFGDVFDNINKSQAENEFATAKGQVNTLIQSFDTFIAANPNATTEVLEAKWKKIGTEINDLPSTMKHPLAIEKMNNYLALTAGSINERGQTTLEAKKSKQEFLKAEAQRELDIANLNVGGRLANSEAMIQAGTWEREKEERRAKVDVIGMEETKKNILIDNAVGGAFAIWESTVTEDNPDGNLNLAFDVVEGDPNIPDGEKQEIESELKTRVTNRRAENKIQLETQRETDRDTISKLMYTEKNFQAATTAIEASRLDEKEQRSLLKESASRADLIARGIQKKDSQPALDKVTTAIAQVGDDTLSLIDAKKVLNDNKANLTDEKVLELTEELNKEFDRSTDTAFSRVRTDVRSFAVGRSESLIDRLLDVLAQEPDKTKQAETETRIATEREKFDLELENFNRWEASLRDWRRQEKNRTASPEEIQKEGIRSWRTEFAGKSIEQLRRESEQETKVFEDVKIRFPDGRTATVPRNRFEALKKEFKGVVEIK